MTTLQNKHKNFIGIQPGVGTALSYGWDRMKANFLVFFLVIFLLAILDIPKQSLQYNFDRGFPDVPVALMFMGFLYSLLFLPVLQYGANLIFIQGARGDEVEAKTVIIGFNNYVNVILVNILVIGLVGISLFLLIVPGIIVACRLAFVSYLVMDENLNPIEAVETSWKITKGHAWTIFGLALTSAFICILGFLMLIVGILPAVMWVKASWASLYLSITGVQEAKVELADGDPEE